MFVDEYSDFNPAIGMSSCFIAATGYKQLIFFHLPVFVMLLGNVVGYIFTLVLVNKTQTRNRKTSAAVIRYDIMP